MLHETDSHHVTHDTMIPIRITFRMTLLAVDTDSLPVIPIRITLPMTLLAVDTDSLSL